MFISRLGTLVDMLLFFTAQEFGWCTSSCYLNYSYSVHVTWGLCCLNFACVSRLLIFSLIFVFSCTIWDLSRTLDNFGFNIFSLHYLWIALFNPILFGTLLYIVLYLFQNSPKCGTLPCYPPYWQCRNGQCIIPSYRCDHHPDCNDSSDEEGCNYEPCSDTTFQ